MELIVKGADGREVFVCTLGKGEGEWNPENADEMGMLIGEIESAWNVEQEYAATWRGLLSLAHAYLDAPAETALESAQERALDEQCEAAGVEVNDVLDRAMKDRKAVRETHV